MMVDQIMAKPAEPLATEDNPIVRTEEKQIPEKPKQRGKGGRKPKVQ